MTPLQEAAKAAREKGLDLPPCRECLGRGTRWRAVDHGLGEDVECDTCARCGVDTSDPYALLGRAMVSIGNRLRVLPRAFGSLVPRDAGWDGYGTDRQLVAESHDGTPESIATAALLLWAQVTP